MRFAAGASPIFPVPDIDRTASFYESLGFRAVRYPDAQEAQACLCLENAQIILTGGGRAVLPNRVLYGSGCDAALNVRDPAALYGEFLGKGAKIVRALTQTDDGSLEFILEDPDGRHIAFGRRPARADAPVLEALPGGFTVCKPREAVRADRPFHFLARTDGECSLVCPTEEAPGRCEAREDGWRCLRVAGAMAFSLVGVLARLSGVLAAAGVSIFAVSTYDTDYLFIKAEDFPRALDALRAEGYAIQERP